ncbi:hypothetical protein ACFX2B_000386 [Malus domestica]
MPTNSCRKLGTTSPPLQIWEIKDLNTVKDNERDLTKTQKKLKEHGYRVNNNKAGLGFTPNAPVKISSKAKTASAQHISVSVIQDKEEP